MKPTVSIVYTEISVLQQTTSNNAVRITTIEDRVRQVEINLARKLSENE